MQSNEFPDEKASNVPNPSQKDLNQSNKAIVYDSNFRDPLDEEVNMNQSKNSQKHVNIVQVRPFDEHQVDSSTSMRLSEEMRRKCTTEYKPEMKEGQDSLNLSNIDLEGVRVKLDLSGNQKPAYTEVPHIQEGSPRIHIIDSNEVPHYPSPVSSQPVDAYQSQPVDAYQSQPVDAYHSQSLGQSETPQRKLQILKENSIYFYERLKQGDNPEIYHQFHEQYSPYVELRMKPLAKSPIGAALLKNGYFLMAFIEYMVRKDPQNRNFRIDLYLQLKHSFVVDSNLGPFQQYGERLQRQLNTNKNSPAEEASASHKASGLKRQMMKGQQSKSKMKNQNSAQKNQLIDDHKGSAYEYTIFQNTKGEPEVRLARKSQRLKQKSNKNVITEHPTRVNHHQLDRERVRAQTKPKDEKNSKKTKYAKPRAVIAREDLQRGQVYLKFIKQHYGGIRIVEDATLKDKPPLRQADKQIFQFLHSQDAVQIDTAPESDDNQNVDSSVKFSSKSLSQRNHQPENAIAQPQNYDSLPEQPKPKAEAPVVNKPWPPSPKVPIPRDVIASEYWKLVPPPYQAESVICSNVNNHNNYAIVRLNKAARFYLGYSHCVFQLSMLNRRSGRQMMQDLEKIHQILRGRPYLQAGTVAKAWDKIEEHKRALAADGLPPDTVTLDRELELLHQGLPLGYEEQEEQVLDRRRVRSVESKKSKLKI